MENRRSLEAMSELIASAREVSSLAQSHETERQIFTEFAFLVDKFIPILNELSEENKILDHPPVQKAVESLGKEFNRAKAMIRSPNPKSLVKQVENMIHDLGRSLGLVLFTSLEVCADFKDKIGVLHRELMNAKLDPGSVASSSHHSASVGELEVEEEIQEERISIGVDEVVVKLKYGDDEELRLALLILSELIGGKKVGNEWIEYEGVIPALFNRLSSSKPEHRLTMIHLLRTLALDNDENKEKMADVGFLSTLVKSLVREEEERREAVGLLLDLSEVSAVRRRIGRIQGCIVLLVALRNGDDPVASRDAAKLLNGLSCNAQNALHMAEAGYFKPIVKYLKEGSDMSKILVATALSRMELTDQCRASLGEDGAIEPLVRMFTAGKLEAKFSALNALQNLSSLAENVQRLIHSGILSSLLQLLFSVTSVLMTLREPASAILARIAESESILVNHNVAQQMLSLLNLSSPVIQIHLLQALNSIASHSSASKARRKMKENGAVQLLLPFLMETNIKIRSSSLKLLYPLSKDLSQELSEQIGETHIIIIINIVSSSTYESEKADALGILSSFPVSDKKVTDILKRENLLPIIVSMTTSSPVTTTPETLQLSESIASVLIRFTGPSDKKLQLYSAENGVITLLVKLLSSESTVAKCRAATSLAQLSQNSLSLKKSRTPRWFCVPPSTEAFCEVHEGYCFVKSTFCLVKAGAVPPLLRILEGNEREADEAVLSALATLLQDEIWENGSNYIAKTSRVQAIVKVLESGNTEAQERALWILERIFRVEEHRVKYGAYAQVVLIDLAQQGDSRLKSTIAKLLAQLELLQDQSSYF
ncbi:U-box domain-containing protein 43 [Morus notabilis]|uniref:U-box domain-containing protein 43 n=1 Tax=Morus notabilis TaxID=981085 RepID=W9QHT2_9ROSA|nr:U-box domain-containing protein 44 isoform X2 [Morus notabilis]EXB37533.1 U-box domain-containing protein 43 [Morus notabilis]